MQERGFHICEYGIVHSDHPGEDGVIFDSDKLMAGIAKMEKLRLTQYESGPTRQRVFVPYLTATELEALRRSDREVSEHARKAFAHLRPKE